MAAGERGLRAATVTRARLPGLPFTLKCGPPGRGGRCSRPRALQDMPRRRPTNRGGLGRGRAPSIPRLGISSVSLP